MITQSALAAVLRAAHEMEVILNSPPMQVQIATSQVQYESLVATAWKYMPDSAILAHCQSTAADLAKYAEQQRHQFDGASRMIAEREAAHATVERGPVFDLFTPAMRIVPMRRNEPEPIPERSIVRKEVTRKIGFAPYDE